MHIEFLVEERSAEVVLENIVPAILGKDVTFRVHSHQGKRDILRKLPDRLRGYSRWLPSEHRIVILVDADQDDCHELKAALQRMAEEAGLTCKSPNQTRSYQVLNRVVIEELEAWFFGDIEALVAGYPRVSMALAKKARYRDPDAIKGGTWEALERELQRAGYHKGGMPKITVARRISEYMVPLRNRSRSFQVFVAGLQELGS